MKHGTAAANPLNSLLFHSDSQPNISRIPDSDEKSRIWENEKGGTEGADPMMTQRMWNPRRWDIGRRGAEGNGLGMTDKCPLLRRIRMVLFVNDHNHEEIIQRKRHSRLK